MHPSTPPPPPPPLPLPPKMPQKHTPLGSHPSSNNDYKKQGFLPPPSRPEPEARLPRQGLLPPHRRTNPLGWCGAVGCVLFSLILIIAGIIILIIFLAIKPRNPMLDTPAASLNSVVLDSPFYLNSDLTFLANFSNPNRKLDISFESISIELYFFDRLIAAQGLPPFAQRSGEATLEAVHMISSEVYLPPELAVELQRQIRSNRVVYNIRGTFKIRVNLGVVHYTYQLYGRCQIELTGPPSGVLIARSCRTKK